jgi:hypothetical protein
VLGVVARDGAQPVRRQERLLVEQALEEPQHALDADDAEQELARPVARTSPPLGDGLRRRRQAARACRHPARSTRLVDTPRPGGEMRPTRRTLPDLLDPFGAELSS